MFGHGKVGGPPGSSPRVISGESVVPAPPKEAPATAKPAARPQGPSDQFESAGARAGSAAAHGPAGALSREATGTTNLLQLARTNPTAARQLVASLASQAAAALAEVEREVVAGRNMLSQLAAERFGKTARERAAQDLRRQREKIASLKLRFQVASRKMALLQQIAGKLGDPRLDEELDRLLQQHRKLKTDWGRRFHLLGAGEALYGALDDTPEHLQHVIKTEVRAGARSGEIGDALSDLSPRRAMSEMIARTIEGSTPAPAAKSASARRGELGKSLQNYSFFTELVDQAMSKDPFDKS